MLYFTVNVTAVVAGAITFHHEVNLHTVGTSKVTRIRCLHLRLALDPVDQYSQTNSTINGCKIFVPIPGQ